MSGLFKVIDAANENGGHSEGHLGSGGHHSGHQQMSRTTVLAEFAVLFYSGIFFSRKITHVFGLILGFFVPK